RVNDHEKLLERINRGSAYYKNILNEKVKMLLLHTAEMKQHKRVKTYLNGLEELDQLFSKTLEEVDKSQLLIEGILNGNQSFDFSELAKTRLAERGRLLDEIKAQFPDSKKGSGKKKGGRKKGGPSTFDITLQMWKEGKDIETIAKERELVPGTIEGHLAKAVQNGQIEIFDFIKEEDVKLISKAIEELPKEFTSKDLFGKLEAKYNYAKLRAVMSYVQLHSK
ncbi:MAG: helix-turn-helix domain-containing protein, partial [Cyclobacteriaceae bacterium]